MEKHPLFFPLTIYVTTGRKAAEIFSAQKSIEGISSLWKLLTQPSKDKTKCNKYCGIYEDERMKSEKQ